MKDAQERAFIEKVNRHTGIAYKICTLYANGQEEKKDMLQEMMYQVWKAFPHFENKSKFSTWMYRVCLNTALTYRKKEKKHNNEPISTAHLLMAAEPASDRHEDVELLLHAISKLSPLNKAIVLLYLEEVSYQEIADITGLTTSNISVKLVRIKKELERILKTESYI